MAELLDTEDQKKRVAESEEKHKLREKADASKILSMPEGKRLIRRIWNECGMQRPYFSQNNNVMANLAGRREVGWFIEKLVRDVSLDTWHQLEREAANDKLLQTFERKQNQGDPNE